VQNGHLEVYYLERKSHPSGGSVYLSGGGSIYLSANATEREGPLVNTVPEGFEIYENVGGQVFLRRKTAKLITDEELALVKEALKRRAQEWRYKAEVKRFIKHLGQESIFELY
jgi:hypothetical protein